MTDFVAIPKYRIFDNKRYTLGRSFVAKGTADRLKVRWKKQGYLVRIVEQKGGFKVDFLWGSPSHRYHIYVRRKKAGTSYLLPPY